MLNSLQTPHHSESAHFHLQPNLPPSPWTTHLFQPCTTVNSQPHFHDPLDVSKSNSGNHHLASYFSDLFFFRRYPTVRTPTALKSQRMHSQRLIIQPICEQCIPRRSSNFSDKYHNRIPAIVVAASPRNLDVLFKTQVSSLLRISRFSFHIGSTLRLW